MQPLDSKFDQSGVLFAFIQIYLNENVAMFDMKVEISQDKNSIIINSNKYFYNLSKFNNVSIVHDKVEIYLADKKMNKSGIIEYIFYKDLDKKYEQYKIKEVYAFFTGFSTGNNSGYKGIVKDLSTTLEQNRIKVSIKSRILSIDLKIVYYNYLLKFIDDLNPSQYQIKTQFNQQFSSDIYPQLVNGSVERKVQQELDVQQEQILKDFQKFLFFGVNKVDFYAEKGLNIFFMEYLIMTLRIKFNFQQGQLSLINAMDYRLINIDEYFFLIQMLMSQSQNQRQML